MTEPEGGNPEEREMEVALEPRKLSPKVQEFAGFVRELVLGEMTERQRSQMEKANRSPFKPLFINLTAPYHASGFENGEPNAEVVRTCNSLKLALEKGDSFKALLDKIEWGESETFNSKNPYIRQTLAVNMIPILSSPELFAQFRALAKLKSLEGDFNFSIDEWLDAILGRGDEAEVGESLLRHFWEWESLVTPEKCIEVFESLKRQDSDFLSTVSTFFASFFYRGLLDNPKYGVGEANYFYRLLGELIEEGALLPLLSFLPIQKLPDRFRGLVLEKMASLSGIDAIRKKEETALIHSSKVLSRRGHTEHTGKCDQIEAGHVATLIDPAKVETRSERKHLGKGVFIVLQRSGEPDQVIGHMKMIGSRNILAFKTISNSDDLGIESEIHGDGDDSERYFTFPMVKNGVYSTNVPLTEKLQACFRARASGETAFFYIGEKRDHNNDANYAPTLPLNPLRFFDLDLVVDLKVPEVDERC